MMTNVSMDVVKFLKQLASDMESDVEMAYPNNYFDESEAHPTLQRIGSKIEALTAFLNALEAPNASPTDPSK